MTEASHVETGFIVRVTRDGKPVSRDIAELTDAELQEYFNETSLLVSREWNKRLAKWIRENVRSAP